MKIGTRMLTVLAVALTVVALAAPARAEIKLGLVDNLAGAAAGYGIPHANGVRLAVEEINAAGGVKGIGKSEIVVEDDGS